MDGTWYNSRCSLRELELLRQVQFEEYQNMMFSAFNDCLPLFREELQRGELIYNVFHPSLFPSPLEEVNHCEDQPSPGGKIYCPRPVRALRLCISPALDSAQAQYTALSPSLVVPRMKFSRQLARYEFLLNVQAHFETEHRMDEAMLVLSKCLAELELELQHVDLAFLQYKKIFAMQCDLFGEQSADASDSLFKLAGLCRTLGQPENALRILEECWR